MCEVCPVCELVYDDFRTGFTYQDIYGMLWSASDDPSTWRYKRRHTILGLWHQIKKEMWRDHVADCREQQREEAAAEVEVSVQAAREVADLEVDIALLVALAATGNNPAHADAVPF